VAAVIPDRLKQSATKGEYILFRTLKEYLPPDYIVYYEPNIKGKKPDFVIIGPDLGIVVLEVKDYLKSSLREVNSEQFVLDINGHLLKRKNPLNQARQYAFDIADILKKDSLLVETEGRYAGNLRFPYGYGAVFTRMYQEDFVRLNLYSVLPPELVLTRDEIDPDTEKFSGKRLLEKIQSMFTNSNACILN